MNNALGTQVAPTMTAASGELAVRRSQKIAVFIFSTLLVGSFAGNRAEAKKKKSPPCAKAHKLTVVDLLMNPDPIGPNGSVRFWRAQIQVDGNGECETIIALRNNATNQLVGREIGRVLKPGLNSVQFEPLTPYRLQGNMPCFSVSAGSAQVKQSLKSERRFCSRKMKNDRWTLRAHEDWHKKS
jgi:hypothetical protein